MRNTSDSLAWLGGANITVLKRAPTARGKFVQMGLVLLTTASIAAISMSFFINHEVHEPEALAVTAGIFWGIIILNLDRFLVVSMGATRERRRLILIAVPRMCLAIVISLVVATPITLRIFQRDINYQLRVSQANQSAHLNGLEAKSGLAQQAKQLETLIQQDQSILNGILPQAVSSPQLQTAQAEVRQLQPQVTDAKTHEIHAYEAWQCELYGDGPGCAGASNRPGAGPIAAAKQAIYKQDLSTYNSLNAQLQTAEHNENAAEASLKLAQGAALARYKKAANRALPGLTAHYNKLEAEIANAHAIDQTAITENTGTLAQLSALWSASTGNIVLLLAHLTIMALFFLIELLPVLIKFLLNLGPLDAYEKAFNVAEEKIGDQVRLERLTQRRDAERKSNERRQIADADSNARIKVAQDKSNRERALGIKANAYVAQRMEDILDAALAQWSAQVTAVLNNAPVTGPAPAIGAASSNGGGGRAGGTPGAGMPPTGTAGGIVAQPNDFGLPPAGSTL